MRRTGSHPPRVPRAVAMVACLALLAAACGEDSDADAAADAAADQASPSSTTQAEAAGGDDTAYPVTIEHAFGSTTIEAEPERVVTVGFSDHDPVLALGVVPVGLTQWYGDHPRGVWPWAEDLLGDAIPALLASDALNFEQIPALEPDLILALYRGLEEEYQTLSQIAPTVAQSGEHPPFGTPWQDMTRTAGRALGRTAEAEALVAGVEARFAAARAEHPGFEGVGLAYAGIYGEQQFYVETEGSTRVQILLDLGFVIPGELASLGSDTFFHDISAERLDLLDQDVVLWEPADISQLPAIEQDQLYQGLAVAREDREVILSDPLVAGAMAHSTVLSLPVALDHLVPALAEATAKLPR